VCNACALLSNDQERHNAFDEAVCWATSNQLRHLFVTMLLFCEVGDEHTFFEKVWRLLVDVIQYNMHRVLSHEIYQMSDTDLRDQLLETLSTLFEKRGSNINDFSLSKKSKCTSFDSRNHLFDEELCYDANSLLSESENMIAQINNEQQLAFESIISTVLSNKAEFFFVSGYGGTGKTFLWNTIIITSVDIKIILSVTSSRVASLLLPRGHTAHSCFRIPCDNLDKATTCNIKRDTMLRELIQSTSLIIWEKGSNDT
jgi:hypothetical protein